MHTARLFAGALVVYLVAALWLILGPAVALIFFFFTGLLVAGGLLSLRDRRSRLDDGFLIPGDFDQDPEPEPFRIRRGDPLAAKGRVP